MTEAAKTKNYSIRDFLLLSISLACCVVGAEIALRYAGTFSQQRFRFGHVRLSDNPILLYELNPEGPEHKALGFRGDPVSKSREDGTFRILVFGDSLVYGLGVPMNASIPERLGSALDTPPTHAASTEVLNLGVPGYSIIQEAELLGQRGLELDPQLVVLIVCLNDWEPYTVEFEQVLASRSRKELSQLSRYYDPRAGVSRLLDRFHLFRAVRVSSGSLQIGPPEWTEIVEPHAGILGVRETSVSQYYSEEPFYSEHFFRFRGLLEDHGIPLVAMLVPYSPTRDHGNYPARLRELSGLAPPGAVDWVYFEAVEVLARKEGQAIEHLFLDDGVHLSVPGAELVANVLASKISPYLSPSVPSPSEAKSDQFE